MNKKPGIRNLKSKKSRNVLRGLISNSNSYQAYEALGKIFSDSGEADFRHAIEVLRESPLFRNGSVGRNFNKKLPKPIGIDAVDVLNLGFLESKIDDNKAKLVELTGICQNVLIAIGQNDLKSALQYCRDLRINGGASIALIKYLYFIKSHSVDSQINESTDRLLKDLSFENARYITTAIRELTSERTDYLNIAEKIANAERSIGAIIAQSFIDAIPRSVDIYCDTISSLYQYSLLDAYLYAARNQLLELPYAIAINPDNEKSFQKLRGAPVRFEELYTSKDNSIGLQVFRESFLLSEIDTFFNYQIAHQSFFNTREAKEDKRIPYESNVIRTYFRSVDSISSIGVSEKESEKNLTQPCIVCYESSLACRFQNSTALVYLLERKDAQIGEEELEFVRAMSITRDIGLILPLQHIEKIKILAQIDELRIVATALSHIKNRGQLKEHELRSILQKVALKNYDGKLLGILEHIHNVSPGVAEHLIQTMDETFLNKLFDIIPNPNLAIQERASILEWYGNRIGDTAFIERAKNLRIDVQINRERGTIDDSRIYVDPVKFTQWISDNVMTDFTLLLESLPQPVEAQLLPIAWEKAKSGLSTHEQISALIVLCYEEFCTNSMYGIASYLGRRIRHGTFKGTGYSDIKNIANNTNYSTLFLNREFEESFYQWLQLYEKILDELRDRHLHIQSRGKPDGLISREFRTGTKRTIASHMLHDILKSYATNGSSAEIPYIVLEYCWRIVEEDLSTIRRFLMEKKSQHAIFRYAFTGEKNGQHRELQEFTREVNSLTAEKFRTISSWFNKPSIASPSADIVLLFKAVVSEIRGHFPSYNPMVIAAEEHFILDGGAYFSIYDALFILIYNAAEGGKADGRLELNIMLDKKEDRKRVLITICSEIRDKDLPEDVMLAIRSALEEDCEDALIFEGRSGIKKLKRMEQAGNIEEVCYRFDGRKVLASFTFKINY